MTENKGTEEKGNKENAIQRKVDSLLPPAKIHFFSQDIGTLTLFQSLGEDWRFSRIQLGVRGETLDEAIQHYARRTSPTVIIIQTDKTDSAFEQKLEDLASVCDEGTAAIVIGPVNDVQLYRRLTNMGISDYLVAPIDVEDIVEAVAHSLQDIVGTVDSHLMVISGVKGGVGTTTLSAMIAHLLAEDLSNKTLIMDASGAQSTLWNRFGFSPSGTLIEAASAVVDKDDDAFDRLIVKKSDHLHILNSGSENILDNAIATQAYEMLLDHCLSLYPYVILDTSGAGAQIKRLALGRASSVGIVATPRVPDLSLTKLMMKGFSDLPGMDSKTPTIYLNKIGLSQASDIPLKDVEQALGTQNIIPIKWNNDIFSTTENSGDPIPSHSQFKHYQSVLIPHLAQLIGLQDFDRSMDQQMTSTLGGLLARITGK